MSWTYEKFLLLLLLLLNHWIIRTTTNDNNQHYYYCCHRRRCRRRHGHRVDWTCVNYEKIKTTKIKAQNNCWLAIARDLFVVFREHFCFVLFCLKLVTNTEWMNEFIKKIAIFIKTSTTTTTKFPFIFLFC